MKQTIVSQVTPHVLGIIDLAKQAENGANVDWHVRDSVARTFSELGHLYNARDLISAYIQHLEKTAQDAGPIRKAYTGVLRSAATAAAQKLGQLD
ncbi:MAG: hypothetical protein K8F33_08130 [Thermomonas sp.]|uniref:hypothetical protein n=1 Tax=Thermomonas sp. TaxID=1971895 RepID=UPI001DCF900D|nr:hypothetical protein [Thermomonas sp.]MBZ0088049.1 hypothetical protein [Thermomonas sp.]